MKKILCFAFFASVLAMCSMGCGGDDKKPTGNAPANPGVPSKTGGPGGSGPANPPPPPPPPPLPGKG